MLVVATKRGFYEGLREPGDQFHVGDKERGSWFEPVETERKPRKGEHHKPAQEPGSDLT